MKFDNDYWHSLDRQYIEKLDVSAKNVGLSTPPMKDQLEGLKTRIFQGASQIELGFMGKAKGSMGQGAPTPEMYGREEREAMRQLARLNEVSTSFNLASCLIASLSSLPYISGVGAPCPMLPLAFPINPSSIWLAP